MAKELVLVIDDEEDILKIVEFNLEKDGYEVVTCADGKEGYETAARRIPDIVVVDLMLPGMDGREICRRLRANAKTAKIPVIMLTAKTAESDIVSGLEIGADDYVTKPFSPKVLIARIRALSRRLAAVGCAEDEGQTITRKGLTINIGRREVVANGEVLSLTFSEFGILCLLARRPGWVFSRGQIIKSVKGDDYPVTDRSIDVQIVSLRRKLGPLGASLETVRGAGYRYKD